MRQIAIVGIDGAGKTTFARMLRSRLSELGHSAIHIDVPHYRAVTICRPVRALLSYLGKRKGSLGIGLHGLLGSAIYAYICKVCAQRNVGYLIVERHPYIDLEPYAFFYAGPLGVLIARIIKSYTRAPEGVLFLERSPGDALRAVARRGDRVSPHETEVELAYLESSLRRCIPDSAERIDLTRDEIGSFLTHRIAPYLESLLRK